MSDAWYLPEGVTASNRMKPHRPDDAQSIPFFSLQSTVHFIGKTFDECGVSATDPAFIERLLRDLQYSHYDVISISEESMGKEKFESMAVTHFSEHLHEDDEVRLILEGGGYFDIRSANDEWIRVETVIGDCIVIPAGMYHRFTTKPDKYIKALRLFKERPKWEAVFRSPESDKNPARVAYLERIKTAMNRTTYARLLLRKSIGGTQDQSVDSAVVTNRFRASMSMESSGSRSRRSATFTEPSDSMGSPISTPQKKDLTGSPSEDRGARRRVSILEN